MFQYVSCALTSYTQTHDVPGGINATTTSYSLADITELNTEGPVLKLF